VSYARLVDSCDLDSGEFDGAVQRMCPMRRVLEFAETGGKLQTRSVPEGAVGRNSYVLEKDLHD
jgi:hypothetical protein